MKVFKSFLLMIVTGILLIFSCTQEEKQVQPNDDLADHIGYWHNVAVGALFDDPSFTNSVTGGNLTFSEIRDRVVMELSRRNDQLFPYEPTRAGLAWSDQVLIENGILGNTSVPHVREHTGSAIDFAAVFRYLNESGEIGDVLYKTFMDLNKKVVSNKVSKEEIIKLSRQMGNLSLSAREKSYVDVFNQVLHYSAKYWDTKRARIQDKKTVGIIWADAAGGLYGMLCGPVCSIIEAAMFSTIMAIQQ
jgi:hypothetical protein